MSLGNHPSLPLLPPPPPQGRSPRPPGAPVLVRASPSSPAAQISNSTATKHLLAAILGRCGGDPPYPPSCLKSRPPSRLRAHSTPTRGIVPRNTGRRLEQLHRAPQRLGLQGVAPTAALSPLLNAAPRPARSAPSLWARPANSSDPGLKHAARPRRSSAAARSAFAQHPVVNSDTPYTNFQHTIRTKFHYAYPPKAYQIPHSLYLVRWETIKTRASHLHQTTFTTSFSNQTHATYSPHLSPTQPPS